MRESNMFFRYVILCAIIMVCFGIEKHAAAYEVPNGPVSVYGQTIDPTSLSLSGVDYVWDDVKVYMPYILPNAHDYTLTKNQVCDSMRDLAYSYMNNVEDKTNYIIYMMEFAVQENLVPPPADLAVTDRLNSKDPADYLELEQLIPDETDKIEQAKIATLQFYTAVYLYNAALAECSSYASSKGYYPIQ